MRDIGQLIIKARKEKGLSRAKLSVITGVPYPTIRDIEKRNKFGKGAAMEKILAVLNMDINLVVKNKNQEPPSASAAG